MPVTLSIKNVPDDVAEQLRARAAANHRSLQGELMSILKRAATDSASTRQARLSVDEFLAEIKQVSLKTPSQSVQMIREDRDSR